MQFARQYNIFSYLKYLRKILDIEFERTNGGFNQNFLANSTLTLK